MYLVPVLTNHLVATHSKTGILVFGHRHNLELRKMIESLIIHSVDHEVLTAEEVQIDSVHVCINVCIVTSGNAEVPSSVDPSL